jgi:hypothetical protein
VITGFEDEKCLLKGDPGMPELNKGGPEMGDEKLGLLRTCSCWRKHYYMMKEQEKLYLKLYKYQFR